MCRLRRSTTTICPYFLREYPQLFVVLVWHSLLQGIAPRRDIRKSLGLLRVSERHLINVTGPLVTFSAVVTLG